MKNSFHFFEKLFVQRSIAGSSGSSRMFATLPQIQHEAWGMMNESESESESESETETEARWHFRVPLTQRPTKAQRETKRNETSRETSISQIAEVFGRYKKLSVIAATNLLAKKNRRKKSVLVQDTFLDPADVSVSDTSLVSLAKRNRKMYLIGRR